MKELPKKTKSFEEALAIMRQHSVVFYGTVRDIEHHFLCSLTNVEKIASYFRSAAVVLFENDSKDRTRSLLQQWVKKKQEGLEKHLLVRDGVEVLYPLRAHRIAFARNEILRYFKKNKYDERFTFAIHCDLDDRFWSVEYEGVVSCFQYSLEDWQVMTCVNRGKTYYDYWALRCPGSWFTMNIFSCANGGVDYEAKTDEFERLLQSTEGLLPTLSSFNGLGIYHLKTLIKGRYDASYYCDKCKGQKRGCYEDNDHIGLHRDLVMGHGAKVFINVEMQLETRPPKSDLDFDAFFKEASTQLRQKRDPLGHYLLKKGHGQSRVAAACVGKGDGEINNLVSNYAKHVHVWCPVDKQKVPAYENDNVVSHASMEEWSTHKANLFCFTSDCCDYATVRRVLMHRAKAMPVDSVLFFEKLMHFHGFLLQGFKALYEASGLFGIKFHWMYVHDESVCLRVVRNPLWEVDCEEFQAFDWQYYVDHYEDLRYMTKKEVAWEHWMNHGKEEGRSWKEEPPVLVPVPVPVAIPVQPVAVMEEGITFVTEKERQEFDAFDWEAYVWLHDDLRDIINDKNQAWQHWTHYGKSEKRLNTFDWVAYSKHVGINDGKRKAIMHWVEQGRPDFYEPVKTKPEACAESCDDLLFDWRYYVDLHDDLRQVIQTEGDARQHWESHGKKENRVCHDFNWLSYLSLNPDLMAAGIDDRQKAIQHWLHHGKEENRPRE